MMRPSTSNAIPATNHPPGLLHSAQSYSHLPNTRRTAPRAIHIYRIHVKTEVMSLEAYRAPAGMCSAFSQCSVLCVNESAHICSARCACCTRLWVNQSYLLLCTDVGQAHVSAASYASSSSAMLLLPSQQPQRQAECISCAWMADLTREAVALPGAVWPTLLRSIGGRRAAPLPVSTVAQPALPRHASWAASVTLEGLLFRKP
jgi:hypothetical protein